jgi:uncharacterized protein
MIPISIPKSEKTLAGFLHPAIVAGNSSRKVLIISHGFNGSIDGSSKAALLAEQAAELGFHVIRYNFTPCRKLTTQIEELTAVVHYAQIYVAPDIYLLGRSMGGSASLAYTFFHRSFVKALCLWATPGDLYATFKQALGEGYHKLVAGERVTFADEYTSVTLDADFIQDFDKYSLYDFVHSMAPLPMLIIHGSEDSVVPLEQAQAMYAAAGSPKKMVVIDGGDHQFMGKTEEARAAVLFWLSQFSREE